MIQFITEESLDFINFLIINYNAGNNKVHVDRISHKYPWGISSGDNDSFNFLKSIMLTKYFNTLTII